tara:strand:- start:177 stop:899 length:723 start_codon:yes stop_codon:yes gene_type:complete
MYNKFSFKEYGEIISSIQKYLPILDYIEVTEDTEKFCVIRHDVEFSIDRAHDLALYEHSLGIETSYMFQIRNNCYNTFSDKNLSKIESIVGMGHKIGLHAHMNALKDTKYIDSYIQNDINILSGLTGFVIDRFSFHRPKREYLELNLNVHNIINTYDKKYFHLTEDLDNLNITYLADSQHKWNYGHPLDLKPVNKLQLLTHPYSWTKKGFDNDKNFKTLIKERNLELKHSINNECKNFTL